MTFLFPTLHTHKACHLSIRILPGISYFMLGQNVIFNGTCIFPISMTIEILKFFHYFAWLFQVFHDLMNPVLIRIGWAHLLSFLLISPAFEWRHFPQHFWIRNLPRKKACEITINGGTSGGLLKYSLMRPYRWYFQNMSVLSCTAENV